MAMVKLPQEIVDALAQGEADALMEGLSDPEMRKNPAFLAKVRQFLKDNNFVTTTATEGVNSLLQDMDSIHDLMKEEYFQ